MKLNFTKEYIFHSTTNYLLDNQNIAIYDDIREPIGKEHYLLLASLGLQIQNKKILEFGTHHGRSAYTMAYGNRKMNNNNAIITYDINKIILNGIFDNTNIDYRIEDLFDIEKREQNKKHILSSDIIFIDIDPHEGIMEYDMYLWLKENDYKGIILFDDIHLTAGHMGVTTGNSMQQFWDKIEDKYKIDLTNVGHWSGTGLVSFHLENHEILYDKTKTIAVLVYGEFRTYKYNLLNNLHELFDEVNADIHFYFLTENCSQYENNKKEVSFIINNYKNKRNINCEIKYFENTDTSNYYNSIIEDKICADYFNIQTQYDKDIFTPKLIYRRCLMNEIMNKEMIGSQVTYDKVIFARLFDVIYKRCKSFDFINDINDNKLYFSVDTLFIGKQEDINILLKLDLISNKIKINNMSDFQKFYIEYDECLGNMLPMCASESIFSAIIFNYFKHRCQNLRFDFSRKGVYEMVFGVYDAYDNYSIINNAIRMNSDNHAISILDPRRHCKSFHI